jgi:2-polyprenyl-3-methyl-5-hydroxy-6-metoxy-1,4-benzoquinol methylase
MTVEWKLGWPHELRDLLDQVVAKLHVESLYFDGEISGLSGARTFRARTDMAEGIGRRVVLKVGERDQIEDEIQRYNDAKNHFGAHPSLNDCAEKGGSLSWIVMSVALEGLGETLRDRFDDLSPEEIATVLDQLFNRAIRLYERTGFNRSCSAFDQYALQSDLIPNLRAIGDTPYTLVDWWNHAAVRDRQQSTEAFVHGDLHGDNVLLTGRGNSIEVRLIDFGLSGRGHAYRDLAKLERDLCLFVKSVRDDSVFERLSRIDKQLDEKDPKSGSGDANIERAVRAIRQIRDFAKGFARVADGDHWRHEYDVALTAQFMFSAGNPAESNAKRRAALNRANTLRAGLIARSPTLESEADAVSEREREDQAWKIAYSLLRLDQLPGGGWSRSLPQWMELLWEGEHGTVYRSPEMKDKGGVDSAGYAVHHLSQFAKWVYGDKFDPKKAGIGLALQACAMALQERKGPHGGIDEGAASRGKPPKIKVRHTLVGLLVHLNCDRMGLNGFEDGVDDQMVDYLISMIPKWEEDKSHLFGMYAAAVALWQVLGELPDDSLSSAFSALRDSLNTHLPVMAKRLKDVMYKPKPEKTYVGSLVQDKALSASFFVPYYDWWRMERSNALMFLPWLLDESGSRFLRKNELGHKVKQRIAHGLASLLSEIEASSNLSEGLIRYHESAGRKGAPRDWGLSAELLRILEMPAIQDLLEDANVHERNLAQKRSVLRRALHETLADYGKYHVAFRYSHGLSIGAYLSEEVARRINPLQVTLLDKQIEVAREELCSEQALHRLAQCILAGRLVTEQEDRKGASPPEAKMITELFVKTLAAGDHADQEHWAEGSYDKTIAYFDSSTAKVNPAVLSGDPIHNTLFYRVLHDFDKSEGERPRVVDLGCGHGLAAKWLMRHEFDITLIDGSEKMIESAKEALKAVVPGKAKFKCKDVREMDQYLDKGSFNLVIANALFVHIAPMHAADLISKVYDVLKPGGRFFFNVKLRDHTLVSLDGRYFAYYPDMTTPKSILQTVGFEVDEIALRENHWTCYDVPKDIHWANFYCRKPE